MSLLIGLLGHPDSTCLEGLALCSLRVLLREDLPALPNACVTPRNKMLLSNFGNVQQTACVKTLHSIEDLLVEGWLVAG
ncbi:hypothetical protein EDS67_07135 [candidate division KSB1 bacterium]|nr:MAG: hypothetical protein EDS67_07135 [candidate division KSB1 bacterium]MBC6951311.1 hypothetical protein [candidate division KSB1 bacterium]MCE7941362.1 hypothetical protein [Chlorobi bacterium CHB1]